MSQGPILERRLFEAYLCFGLLFYAFSPLFGGGTIFKLNAPGWLLASRDVLYLSLLIFLLYRLRGTRLKEVVRDYGGWFKWYFLIVGAYMMISLSHVVHRPFLGVLQHELRNTIGYSGVLILLPMLESSRRDWRRVLDIFLVVGVLQAAYAIVSRYTGFEFMTWSGRVTGTMADPNNFSVFMALCVFILLARWEQYRVCLKWPLIFGFLIAFSLASSVTGLGFLCFGSGLLWILKHRNIRSFFFYLSLFYGMMLSSYALKVIENPGISVRGTLSGVISVDRYLVDKLDNFSGGRFSKNAMFGLKVNPDEPKRTLSNRHRQVKQLFASFGAIKIFDLWFGDSLSSEYRRFDSQYLNLFWNTGFASILLMLGLFSPAFYLGFLNWKRSRDETSLIFWVFLMSLFIVGFNGSALLNRFPLNLIAYLALGAIVLLSRQVPVTSRPLNQSGDYLL